MKVKIKNAKPEEVMKEAFWLAWNACGGPLGMGFLQNNPDATKDDVWDNISRSGDYPMHLDRKAEVYGDYVFGRMMKLGFTFDKGVIEIRDEKPRIDYQAWCRKYPTYKNLVEEAAKNVGAEIEQE